MRTPLRLLVAALTLATGACGRPPAGDSHAGHGMASAAAGSATTAVTVSAAERARLGITLATATSRALEREVRLVGTIATAETAVRAVTPRIDGFVERLHVDFTGRTVRRGEPLLDLYSPTLVAAQQELLLALRLRGALGPAPSDEARRGADSLVEASRRRLAYWDVDADQIAALERSGAVQRTMTLRAPISGVVLAKTVVEGQALRAGAEAFRIADLMTVWLEADVFESDLAAMRTGLEAEVTFDAYPGETLRGRVAYLSPTVDPTTRTGRVRLELHNHDGRLRPGLFGTVVLRTPLGPRGVVIPREAVLVTGGRQVVFVAETDSRFVLRDVTLGAEADSFVQVRAGLRAGERVAAAAAFFLDAEANLGSASAAPATAPADLGTGTPRSAPATATAPAAAPAPAHRH